MYSLLKSHNPTICTLCSDKNCNSNCKTRPSLKKPKLPTKETTFSIPKNEIKSSSGLSLRVLETNLLHLEKDFQQHKE